MTPESPLQPPPYGYRPHAGPPVAPLHGPAIRYMTVELTPAERTTWWYIYDHPSTTIKQAAGALGISQAALYKRVARMVDKGWVRRRSFEALSPGLDAQFSKEKVNAQGT